MVDFRYCWTRYRGGSVFMWWQVSFYRRLSSNGNIFLTLKRFMHLSVRSSLRKPSTTNALTTTVFNDYHTHIRRAMTLKFLPFFIFLYFLFIFSPLFKKMLSRPNEVLFTAFWKRKRKRKRKRWKQHFFRAIGSGSGSAPQRLSGSGSGSDFQFRY